MRPLAILAPVLLLAGCFDPITSTNPGPPGEAQALSAGTDHACGLEADGALKCWGRGGLVGDGTRALRATAVPVRGLEQGGVLRIATGDAHSCALTTAGTVLCWGKNDLGQLGTSDPSDRLEPVEVGFAAPGPVSAVAAGARHACAIQPLGDVWCWGDNAQWQVGAGAATVATTPNLVRSAGGQPAYGNRSVAAGDAHSCVVTGNGEAHCWGSNAAGQLGTGTAGGVQNVPQRVLLDVPVTAITAGRSHTCALLVGGAVRCWGSNAAGQLGDDTGVDSATPVAPKLDGPVLEISAGGDSTCAVGEDHFLRCWGDNASGQVGDGTNLQRFRPVLVSGLTSNVRSVAVGRSSACAVTLGKKAYCWGRNDQGQLGDGTNVGRNAPVGVQGL